MSFYNKNKDFLVTWSLGDKIDYAHSPPAMHKMDYLLELTAEKLKFPQMEFNQTL